MAHLAHHCVALALLVPGLALASGCLRKANTCETDADCFSDEQCVSTGVCAPRVSAPDMSASDMNPPDMSAPDAGGEDMDPPDMDPPDMNVSLGSAPLGPLGQIAGEVALLGEPERSLDAVFIAQDGLCARHIFWRGGSWQLREVLCADADGALHRPKLWRDANGAMNLMLWHEGARSRARHLTYNGASWDERSEPLALEVRADVAGPMALARSGQETWLAVIVQPSGEAPEVRIAHQSADGAAWSTPAVVRINGAERCDAVAMAVTSGNIPHGMVSCQGATLRSFHHIVDDGGWRQNRNSPIISPPKDSSPGLALIAADAENELWAFVPNVNGTLSQISYSIIQNTSSMWSAPSPVTTQGQSAHRPQVVRDAQGALHILHVAGPPNNRAAWYTHLAAGAAVWSTPFRVLSGTDDPQVALWVSPAGQAHYVIADPGVPLHYGRRDP